MSEPNWQYTSSDNSTVWRKWPDGQFESCFVSAPEYQAWLAEGNTPTPYTPPVVQPARVMTPKQKLEAMGLTLDDLSQLIAEANAPRAET